MSKIMTTYLLIAVLFTSASSQPGIWSPCVNLSNNNNGSNAGAIAISDDNFIHVAWSDNSRLGGGVDEHDILYCKFNEETWSQPVQLSAYGVTSSRNPRIAADSQYTPHVVWIHNAYTIPEIYYTFITDSGWCEPVNISQNPLPSQDADIGIDSQDHVHIIWSDGYYGSMDIFHREFNGFNWLSIDTVYQGVYSCTDIRFAIDSQDRIHLTWQDFGNLGAFQEIGYMIFDGISWSEPENISNWPEEWSTKPDIDLDSNDLPHIVWSQLMPVWPEEEIFYSYFDGLNWSFPENVTNTGLECGHPSFTVTDQGVKHLLFYASDQFGNEYVNYTYNQNGVWSEPDTIIVATTSISSDQVIGTGNIVHAILNPMVWFGNSETFYTYTTAGTVSLVAGLIPESPSITIPSAGGSFTFDVEISNVQVVPITFDVWIDVVLPNGSVYGPVILREDIEMPAGGSIQRPDMQQSIPAGAPPGEYSYRLQLGSYADNVIVSADSFAFYKEGVSSSAGGDWSLRGWDGECQSNYDIVKHASSDITHSCNPNPFNPTTTIRFGLPVASITHLRIFDIQGRLVVELVDGWRDAGYHEVTFEAAGLASGVYLYRMQAENFTSTGKMLLIK